MFDYINEVFLPRRSFVVESPTPELQVQWDKDGFVLLKGAVPHALIDAFNDEVAAYRNAAGETKDEFGFGQRIGLLHCRNARALRIAQNKAVQSFLGWVFKDRPLLFGSLTFETGSEQAAHQDAIFFYTQPEHCMAGAWTALEDVHPDAGPLFYIRGSHKWKFRSAEDVCKAFPEFAQQLEAERSSGKAVSELTPLAQVGGGHFNELLAREIDVRNAKKEPALASKGDVLIWHAHLVHGGLPRLNRSLTRKSLVYHYVSRNGLMWDTNAFFCLKKSEFNQKTAIRHRVRTNREGSYVLHKKPVTY